MPNESELLKLLLPEFLITHFEILKFEEENSVLHLYFEEKNTVPKEFSSLVLQSKGFFRKSRWMTFHCEENP